MVFNKVSSLSQKKHDVKLTQEGLEVCFQNFIYIYPQAHAHTRIHTCMHAYVHTHIYIPKGIFGERGRLLSMIIISCNWAYLQSKKSWLSSDHCTMHVLLLVKVFREFYPSHVHDQILECVWKEDKFVLIEKKDPSFMKDQSPLPPAQSIQYEIMDLFDEGKLYFYQV